MATLSVVLAVFNEEKNLADCLQSVKKIADEIIIVDGGSLDATVSIAESFNAKVIRTGNPQIFHINKQKAINAASKDWILQLDADERVTVELEEEIRSVLREDGANNGYWIPRKNYFLGRFLMKGGQYPDYTLRLYRRGKGRLPQKDVHEQAIVEGKVGTLQHPLVHMADPSFRRYLLRFGRYTDLFAEQIADEKPNPVVGSIRYLLLSPAWWFVMTYGRHKGFMDSWQGFVFSFFSSLRFPVSYIKYMRRKNK